MKTIILFLFTFTTFLFASTTFTDLKNQKDNINFTQEEQKYLDSKEYLTTQGETGYKPFLFQEDGEYSGIIADMLKLMSEALNKEIRYIPVENFSEAKQLLKENKIDFLNHYIYTKERAKQFLFSKKSIFSANIGFIYNNSNPQAFKNLDNKTVAIVKGFHLVKLMKRYYPKVKVVEVQNNEALLKSIINKEVDAALTNYDTANYINQQQFFSSDLTMKIMDNEHFFTKEQHFVFHKERQIVQSIMDKALDSIYHEQMNNLFDKWALSHNKKLFTLKEEEYIKNNVVNLCLQHNLKSINYIENGQLKGMYGDVYKEIRILSGLKFNYIDPSSYRDLNQKVANKECDMVTVIGTEQKRFLNINSSKIVNTEPLVALAAIEHNEEIDYEGYFFYTRYPPYKTLIENYYPGIKIFLEPNLDIIEKELKRDKHNMAFFSISDARNFIKKYGYDKYKIIHKYDDIQFKISLGIEKEKTILLSIINKSIEKIGTEKFKQIHHDHTSHFYNIKRISYKWLWYVVAVLFLFILLLQYKYIKALKTQQLKEKEQNEKLEIFKDTLTNATQMANLGTWEWDAIDNITRWSDTTYSIYGISKNQDINLEFIESLIYKEDLEKHRFEVNRSLKLHTPFDFEYRIVKDGELRIIHALGNPIVHENLVIKMVGAVQDITELKENELKLLESQKIAKLGYWRFDNINNTLEWSDEIYNIFEIEKDKFDPTYEGFMNSIHPDDRNMVNSAYLTSLANKKPYNITHRLLMKDGRVKWVEEQCTTTFNETGEPLISSGTVQDITEKYLSRQKYKTILDLASDGIHILDLDGNIIEFSKSFADNLGYTMDETAKLNVLDWNKTYTKESFSEFIKSLSDSSITYETIHTKKDGTTIEVQINAKEIYLDGIPYLYASQRDITKQKILEHESKVLSQELQNYNTELLAQTEELNTALIEKEMLQEKFSNLFHKTPLSSFILNEKLFVLNSNNIAKEVFSKRFYRDQVNIVSLFTHSQTRKIIDTFHLLKKEKNLQFELFGLEGEHKQYYKLTATYIDFEDEKYLVLIEDITKEKELEKQIIKEKDLAQSANRAKSEFLANMSHEIRTPLNGMIGLTDLALETDLDNVQKGYLEKSKKSSLALLGVINDILDYSKIEAKKLTLIKERFELDGFMKNISDMFSHTIHEKGIDFIFKIDPDIPRYLISDSLRLNQILSNFLSNAIKFTKDGSIVVGIDYISQEKEHVKLNWYVEDTGIGISKEKQLKLFKAFEQGDSTTTKEYGGTGLGLVISKQLIELFNGVITMQSIDGEGSRFGFEITMEIDKNSLEDQNNINHLNVSNLLILSSNEMENQSLKLVLDSWGIENQVVHKGLKAQKLIEENQFDYIFVNPAETYEEMLKFISDLQKREIDLPVIIMVKKTDKKLILQEIYDQNIHISKVLEKPYTPSDIYNLICSENSLVHEENTEKDIQLKESKMALIVEDNETNQLVASKKLENLGFEIDLANDGAEAVEKVKDCRYDIVFMDLHMPRMDGYTASKEILEFNSEIPIVALSAAVMEEDKLRSKESGMKHHISKPIIADELHSIVKEYFETVLIEKKYEDKSSSNLDIYGVNYNKLMESLSYDTEYVNMLLKKFYHSYIGTNQLLKNTNISPNELAESVHKLKGVSGNLKIEKLFNLCSEFKALDEKSKLQALNEIEVEIEQVTCSIKEKILDKEVIGEVKKFDRVKFDKLISDLKQNNYIQNDRVESITLSLKNKVSSVIIEKINDCFSKYQYSDLVEILEEIKKDLDVKT